MNKTNGASRNSALAVNRIRPAYEQVADQLLDLLVQGSLVPGDRLPVEADLASSFGVSRGTVREALRVLASRNLVYSVRGATGGTFVAECDPAALSAYLETGLGLLSGAEAISLDELLEARQLLEVPAARLAAERRTKEDIELLKKALDEEQAPKSGIKYQAHRRFHVVLLEASGNRLLHLMTLPIFGVIRSRFVIQPSETELWHDINHDHSEMLQIIIDGDGDRAAEAMTEHLIKLNSTYRALESERGTNGDASTLPTRS